MNEQQPEQQDVLKFKRKPDKRRLNKRTIDALPAPPEQDGKPTQSWTYDATTPRLAICVWSSGSRVWYWIGRGPDGRMLRHKLGRHPEVTPEQAKKLAAKVSAEIAGGNDPRHEKWRQRKEPTLGEFFQTYLDEYAKVHKKSWRTDEQLFHRYCGPLKSRSLSSVTSFDITTLHSRVGRDHGHYAANRLLSLLSRVYWLAEKKHCPKGNPCRGIRRFKEESRERFLNGDELARFFAALEQESDLMRDYFLLALLTGARRGNVQSMRFDELDLDQGVWKIPGAKFKNGREQTVHLPAEAVAILKRRREEVQGDYVFPSRTASAMPHLTFQYKAWGRVCQRADLQGVRPHDLRRTLGSWQAATGASLPIIGKTLGQLTPSVTAVYARLDLSPVRQAVDTAVNAMLAAANGAKKEGGEQ